MSPAADSPSILLVEDDDLLRELYRAALKNAGYSVTPVADGMSALHILEVHIPDLIVLDLGLPRLGGRDVHKEMMAKPATRNIPVIIVSGLDTSDLDPDAFAGIFKKPTHPDRLIDAVGEALRLAYPELRKARGADDSVS